MTVRRAEVDLHGDHFYVSSYSQTDSVMWVATGQPVRLPADCDPSVLGAAVREAFDRSGQGIPTPPRDADLTKPLLELAGERSYAAYVRGTRSVSLRTSETPGGELISATPQSNQGARNGFRPIKDRTITFADDSPERVGRDVIRALGHATA